ncbi:lysylphosphatidylglycerol synthase transmembrane domain-containing protein [Kallotenue papyrolyticum]|uniref:lysylphosphatidylglycerol synthase transmembrane domain-containing protein n=1 Tax=Kallotenue papyrolyticum TaxID=1325125 RepID=UPI0004BB198D|nr:lysylphosphatidylglycerol synthase transmembrane domain-containing protein [Kallotenue papyrolyticum]
MILAAAPGAAIFTKEGCALRSWKFWLGVLISAVFVWLTARGLEWHAFTAALRDARYGWLVPAIGIYFVAVLARTWRWQRMLRPMQPIALHRLFPLVVIGYTGNNIFPARAGEVLRSYLLRRQAGISVSASLATVALERLFDGLMLCVFALAMLPFLPLPVIYERIALLAGGAFLMALLILLLLATQPTRAEALTTRLIGLVTPSRLRDRVTRLAARFLSGLHVLRSPRDLAVLAGSSALAWLAEVGTYWFTARAFAQLDVSFATLLLMAAVVNLATMIPSAPGYVGTFDKPGIEVLKAFGHPTNLAAAFTVVLHVVLWLPITLLGLLLLLRSSLGRRALDVVAHAPDTSALATPSERRDWEALHPKP